MKVLHISLARVNEFSDPEKWLHRINFFTGILEELAFLGCDVESIHLINYAGTLTRNDVKYHFLPLRNISPRLWVYVRRLAPDVVVLHGLIFPFESFLLSQALPKSIKFFMQHHAERPLLFPKSLLQKILDRNKIAGYFFSANGLADSWVRAGQISNSNKIFEVMEVSSRFTPSSAANEINNAKDFKYLWVGRLDSNKDPLTLVKAFSDFLKEFPGHQLQIIFRGGSLLPQIQNMIPNGQASSIILVGEVEHEELEQWYRRADFIISTSHYEGSGTAVCEGLSCGCIPILSDIPSFRMMTGEGDIGFMFTPGETHSLRRALSKSLEVDRHVERERVLQRFQAKLSFKAIARDMYNVFEKL